MFVEDRVCFRDDEALLLVSIDVFVLVSYISTYFDLLVLDLSFDLLCVRLLDVCLVFDDDSSFCTFDITERDPIDS